MYGTLRALIRLVLRLYYGAIEVYGRATVPREGRPTLFVANHQTGLVDGALLLGIQDRVVRLIIKNTLWDIKIVAFFANGLGMIPVFRRQDLAPEEQAKADPHRNDVSFARIAECFRRGEAVVIFPEGKSHNESSLQRLRSGPARMLLESELKSDFRLGTQWLPVAIDLQSRDRPGGRALVHYHPPRSTLKWRELAMTDFEAAVNGLRDEMDFYLRDITLNFDSWDDRLIVERLTEMWLAAAPVHDYLERHNQLLKWKRILEATKRDPDAAWPELKRKLNEAFEFLQLLGLTPADLFARNPRKRRFVVARLGTSMFFWAPLILIGKLVWWLPTRTIARITLKGAGSKLDVVSTYQLLAGLVLYPAWSTILLVGLWATLGFQEALGFTLIAVSCGVAALAVSSRVRVDFARLARGYRLWTFRSRVEHGRGLVRDVWALAALLWQRGLERQVELEPRAT